MYAARLVVALAVLLAGCSAVMPGGADDGTVNVYVSDDPGAIEEFEQLNLTISAFSLRAAETSGEHDDDGRHRHRHDRNWTTYDINATTVDLTELRGPNASLLHAADVPEGEYTAVSVHVAGVNATLETGTTPTVTVPGDRLTVAKQFTVNGNESVQFVVDAVVKERRDNETYVLRSDPDASGADADVRPRYCDCCGTHNGTDGTHGHHGNKSHHDGGHGTHENGTDGCRHG
ncbi:MAG: DUF4382 domain-containing protein [Halolamina sp.]